MQQTMHITMVDDDLEYLSDCEQLFNDYAEELGLKIMIKKFTTPDEFLSYARKRGKLEIVLLDNYFGDGKLRGIEALYLFNQEFGQDDSIKFIISSASFETNLVMQAVALGVKGYFVKDKKIEDLVQTVQEISKGNITIFDDVQSIFWMQKKLQEDLLKHLTPSEKDILELLAAGKKPAAIAKYRNTSKFAVDKHISNIFKGIGVNNRIEAADFFNMKGYTASWKYSTEKDFGLIKGIAIKGRKNGPNKFVLTMEFDFNNYNNTLEAGNKLSESILELFSKPSYWKN